MITPTIGRKLYYQPRGAVGIAKYDAQPIDATIVYVWPQLDPSAPYLLNLALIDHSGAHSVAAHVPLIQEGYSPPDTGPYAEWMPYQNGQAKKAMIEQNVAIQQQEVAQQQAASLQNAGLVLPNVESGPTIASGSSQPASSEQPQPVTSEATPTFTNGDSGSLQGFNYSSDFAGALSALKGGKRVARSGWNGKGMFVYLVPAASYPAQTGAAKSFFGEGSLVPYNAYLALKGVDNTVSTWVPSVNDVLADDWSVL